MSPVRHCAPVSYTHLDVYKRQGLIGIQRDGQGDIHFSFGDMVKKVLSINIVVIFISLLLVALRVTVPVFFMDIAGKLGNTCTPLSLIFCGATMYEVFQNHGLRGLAIPRDTLYVFISRFVICPLLMFGICTLFGIGGIARTVFVIISAMPTQSQTVIMSSRYGADVDFASITCFWTTLACFVVIPILLTLSLIHILTIDIMGICTILIMCICPLFFGGTHGKECEMQANLPGACLLYTSRCV